MNGCLCSENTLRWRKSRRNVFQTIFFQLKTNSEEVDFSLSLLFSSENMFYWQLIRTVSGEKEKKKSLPGGLVGEAVRRLGRHGSRAMGCAARRLGHRSLPQPSAHPPTVQSATCRGTSATSRSILFAVRRMPHRPWLRCLIRGHPPPPSSPSRSWIYSWPGRPVSGSPSPPRSAARYTAPRKTPKWRSKGTPPQNKKSESDALAPFLFH